MYNVMYRNEMGAESHYEVENVSMFVNKGSPIVEVSSDGFGVTFGPRITGSSEETHEPTVFVMNRFGATIAKYKL